MRQSLGLFPMLLLLQLPCAAQRDGGPVAAIPESVMVNWLQAKVQPVLTKETLATAPDGTVVLRMRVGMNGRVEHVEPVSGPESLYAPYTQAVRQWVYIPYVWQGRKLRVNTTVTLVLNRGEAQPFEPMPAGAPGGGTYAPVSPTLSPAAQAVGTARVPAAVLQSLRIQSVPPVYPKEAKAARVSGTVVLHVLVGRTGQVEDARPISGPELLQAAAAEAVCQWTYRPYLQDGKAQRVESTVTVNFALAPPRNSPVP